jgi:hypothetical protein
VCDLATAYHDCPKKEDSTMSGTKRMMDEEDQKREAAVGLMIAMGYLKRCPIHDEIIFTTGEKEPVDAYKFGNTHWARYSSEFESSRDMTDHIKAVSEDGDYMGDECALCDKARGE